MVATLRRAIWAGIMAMLLPALILLAVLPCRGQTVATLHMFSGGIESDYPHGDLILGADGYLYGTTQGVTEGNCGTVFKISPLGVLTTLHSFTGPDGSYPAVGLTLGSDGAFYGVTALGGAFGSGTVFKMTYSGDLTTLYTFGSVSGDGVQPAGALVQGTDGNFYGTTFEGGVWQQGTVFSVTPSGTLTTLYSFSGPDGGYPRGALVQGSDGRFYGTTSGTSTVFSITTYGTLATLHAFSGADGSSPREGLMLGRDGNFYGTTIAGGGGNGTVFRITPDGTLTTLYVFNLSGGGGDGMNPDSRLVQDIDGTFYGTTFLGGAHNFGTVFKMTPDGVLTTIYSFSGTDGRNPAIGMLDVDGATLYSATTSGGPTNFGTIFAINIVTVTKVVFSPSSVIAGEASQGTASIGRPAPVGGAKVQLTSSASAAIPPATVIIPAGKTSAKFNIKTSAVSAKVVAKITAGYNGTTTSSTLTVNPVTIESVTVSPGSVLAGEESAGTVTLSAPALPGGTEVALASSIAGATVPATVTVAAGKSSARFAIKTTFEAASASAKITATLNGGSRSATLSIKPTKLTGFTITPATVTGGTSAKGVITFSSAVPDGTLTLTSGSSVVTVAPTVAIPAGKTSVSFKVGTSAVTKTTKVKVTASFNGAVASAMVTVNP
jgi:uncharacterized repeat protein (TIGR03803 family)